jgi:spermidine synthase
MFLSGYCGILSELSLFNLGTVLLGGANVTLLYTMGVMMFCMGLGSWITELKFFKTASFDHFAWVELILSVFCMSSVSVIYYLSGIYPWHSIYFFVAYSMIIGTLIGIEIPLVLRLNELIGMNLQQNSARVMMADYFGSLVAFVMFPYVLFPLLGVSWSAYSGGLINLLMALAALITFSKRFTKPITALGLSVIVSAFALFFGQNLNQLNDYSEQQLFRDPVVYKTNTKYQTLMMTQKSYRSKDTYTRRRAEEGKTLTEFDDGFYTLREFNTKEKGDIRFFINGGLQFSTIDEYRYHEYLVHPLVYMHPKAESALVLGGGDGLAVRELLKHDQIKEVLLVDLDGRMTDLFTHSPLASLNDYSLQDPRVRVVNMDAFVFLREAGVKFPLIVIDFPDPYCLQTAKLYSAQFFELVKSTLTDDGFYSIQSTSPLFNRKVFISIGKTLRSIGLSAVPGHINMKTFEEWGFHFGSKTTKEKELFNGLLEFNTQAKTRYLDNAAMRGSLYFGKDTFFDKQDIPINELDRLILVGLYRSDW